jgi:RimJ/RimL family protein N-acetyltransferase
MRYIGFYREDEAESWAREKLDLPVSPGFYRAAAAVDGNDEFVCVVVMTNFSPRNVDFNVVIEKRKFRPKAAIIMFNEIFDFVFNRLGVARVTGLIPSKNTDSCNLAEHFGFQLEGVMRAALDDDDVRIYSFLADEYRSHAWHRG